MILALRRLPRQPREGHDHRRISRREADLAGRDG
jgi:hypothetical protein